ncbi:salicylate hydroxylase [Cladophialophora carrionii]|uniref:Salicylate hydroxylase n=1 Tax=Cladophialophora carrionii TaxID=86049 RepID=A0A1C1CW56_9EURO|nr:salicylate hydroxylase [Cladophialophora carrionii]
MGEIGAGLQTLANSSRVLISWGMGEQLSKCATTPRLCNMIGWRGETISTWDIHKSTREEWGSPYWDLHRVSLHQCLWDRAVELGAEVRADSRVTDVRVAADGSSATVILRQGEKRKRVSMNADLVVGADGIRSHCRDLLVGRDDPPAKSGDMAYRVLLNTDDMLKDPELRDFVLDPQVNYWIGPECHVVSYVLRGGKQFNMVLLVPDDLPEDVVTQEGNVESMQALFKDWDPSLGSVKKWRLCTRTPTPSSPSWYHPSGTFVLLGDSVHATLPYLASGAGMAIEDASVLGLCLSRISSGATAQEKLRALKVYEMCRKPRTRRVVEKAYESQYLYHLPDGPEQRERDGKMKAFEDAYRIQGNGAVPSGLKQGDDPFAWRSGGVGKWLFEYDCELDVERCWTLLQAEEGAAAARSASRADPKKLGLGLVVTARL